MSEQKDLVAVEQPQQLITIEPTKYVALVFENHRTRADAYKDEAPTVTYDITTTAGMKTAVEWRAKGRDIRVDVTDVHRERKAPILEIGRLMDTKKKEIIADIEPDEDRFDRDIKAEIARKEAEKAAKAASEKARIDFIRKRISEIQAIPSESVGRSAADLVATIELTQALEITLQEFGEFSGECEMAKVAALARLREMQEAQRAHEAEQARLAAERVELERLRAEAAERERVAADARATAERQVREAREREESRLKAERAAYEEELRRQREADESRLRAERELEERRLAEQRAELARQQAAIDAARAEQERKEREAREVAESSARAEAERVAAEDRRKREEAEAAARAEAERIERERQAEAERAALAAEVARLHALRFSSDSLGMLEDVLEEIARPIGQECCGLGNSECCGCPNPAYHDVDSLSIELNKWREEIIARRTEQKEAA